jgi:hypothetical protein
MQDDPPSDPSAAFAPAADMEISTKTKNTTMKYSKLFFIIAPPFSVTPLMILSLQLAEYSPMTLNMPFLGLGDPGNSWFRSRSSVSR